MIKSKVKFNIIDFLIVFVVLAVLVSVFLRESTLDIFKEKKQDVIVRYTMLVEGLRDTSMQYINEGTKLYLLDEGDFFGEVKSVEFAPSKTFGTSENGSLVEVTDPLRYDATITVECKAYKTETGYMVNGEYFVAIGKVVYTKSSEIIFGSTVLDFEEIEK